MVLPNRHKRLASAKARARKGLPPKARLDGAEDSVTRPDGDAGDDVEDADGASGSDADGDDARESEADPEAEAFERASCRPPTEADNEGEQIAAFLEKQTRSPGAFVSARSHRSDDAADVDTAAQRLLAVSSSRPATPQPSTGSALDCVVPLGREIERDSAARGAAQPATCP